MIWRRIRHLIVSAACVPLALPLTATFPAVAGTPRPASGLTCEPWAGVEPPNPGGLNDDVLTGVKVLSGCDAWAVGLYQDAPSGLFRSLIVRWNGSSWRQVKSPNPDAAASYSELFGVTATSPGNAWAVGLTRQVPANVQSVLIARWNGRSWRQQPSPRLASDGGLGSVAATSARDAWAVGSASDRPLIEHWNGTRWSVAQIQGHPFLQRGGLAGVAAVSVRDAWAAGTVNSDTLLVRWDGSTWRRVPSPNPAGPAGINVVLGIAATAPGDAWAVGFDRSAAHDRTMIMHWNGTAWKVVPSPNPGGRAGDNAELFGVTATSKNDAWAVGGSFAQNGSEALLVLHWNGRTWRNVPVPSRPGPLNEFTGVDASSATSVWIVGFQDGNPGIRTLALHCC